MSLVAKLDRAGRVMVPREFRERLNISEGMELVVRIEDGELRLSTRAEALRRAQRALADLKRPGQSVVDDFIAERLKEAQQD
ncbi:MAG: AbrB/MazE/SpoVT family DNA-binding domain-containing protein [Bryobacteraceae bacterium]